jgi:hypothetical protein
MLRTNKENMAEEQSYCTLTLMFFGTETLQTLRFVLTHFLIGWVRLLITRFAVLHHVAPALCSPSSIKPIQSVLCMLKSDSYLMASTTGD